MAGDRQIGLGDQALGASRAGLYQALAELLAAGSPPHWLAAALKEWPLYTYTCQLSPVSPAAREAVARLSCLPAVFDPFLTVVAFPNALSTWLYESTYFSGHLLGPELLAVEQWYRRIGLQPLGAELPHHASLELACLAYLAENADALPGLEDQFLRQHPGRWLPQLGQALSRTGYTFHALVGDLLSSWIDELTSRPPPASRNPVLPVLARPEHCTLCGFCVQRCPQRALSLFEDDQTTWLELDSGLCSGCGDCLPACVFGALQLQSTQPGQIPHLRLKSSGRGVCRRCGKALVSRAELRYLAGVLNDPGWLQDCLDCRMSAKE